MEERLLVIDDDEGSCRLLTAIFQPEGLKVLVAHDGASGIAHALKEQPSVVLLDVGLPGASGLDVLTRLKATIPSLPILMLTASHELKTAVRATQLGAFDYLTKPIDRTDVLAAVRRALETHSLRVEVEDLRRRVGQGEAESLAHLMGPSREVAAVIEQVGIVAQSEYSVLVLGETGTGKELVAQAIHRQSHRSGRPYIALDCGAIPEQLLESELFGYERGAFTGADRRKPGHFQLAEGGTCFLDEVGNLPPSLQAKLLRVLESKQLQPVGSGRATRMDVRFITATNTDLESLCARGQFRLDLYFRLAQYAIVLPPLRARVADIAHLTNRFLQEASVELRRPVQEILPEALELLEQHDWPGNVRQLRNVVRHAVLRTKDLRISPEHLRAVLEAPQAIEPVARKAITGQSLRAVALEAARTAERQVISEMLRRTGGNKALAARALQTDYKTLHVKMKNLGIRSHDFRSPES